MSATKFALWATWVVLISGFVSYATAQLFAPNQIDGCVVLAATPSPAYTAGQRVALTCNTAGQLRTTTTP